MDEFKIIYKNRFPIRQKRADGTFGCRGCGSVVPKNRRTWCSRDCAKKFDPGLVIMAVKVRDKEICQICSLDCRAAYVKWLQERAAAKRWSDRDSIHKPPIAEYDHIIPFSEGGLTVVENMRTLCSDCHKKVTAEWHKQRSKKTIIT